MLEHRKLLAEYSESGSEEAFRELVRLYIGLVHSSALRLVGGDAHRAEDIAQTVFSDLARLSRTIPRNATLGGWLHRRACHVAATMMRGERRRQNREKEAAMESYENNDSPELAEAAPALDEAINELDGPDRQAIMLRFFENCSLRSVGEALGSSEDAAQKRVARALEKLRLSLMKRGIVLSVGALTLALVSASSAAAPTGLTAGVSTAALASAQAKSGGLWLTILKTFAMTKLQTAVIATVGAIVLAGAGTTVVLCQRNSYVPPSNASPDKVLEEARADAAAGRFKEALAKQVWYHENALRYPSQAGVRRSFALLYWEELGKKYPPALKKLKSIRDQAGDIAKTENAEIAAGTQAFLDFAAINRTLKDG